jgi:SAM-dependent methyltransferase
MTGQPMTGQDAAPRRSLFDAAAAEYDRARPGYPDEMYDAIEQRTGRLAGQLVLDCGAGTGIASRQLAARGARVLSLDIGEQMLRRALARSPGSRCILADGNRLPVRAGCADVLTFAQSWHWFDPQQAAAEVARVLRAGGWWAAWWNQAAPGEQWFSDYQALLTATCPDYRRQHHSPDWSHDNVTAGGLLAPAGSVTVRWTRQLTVSDWITDDRSKSYVIALADGPRERLLAQVAAIIGQRFPDGRMRVPYATRLWLASKRGQPPRG